jgi:hypothetical protein
MFKFETDVRLNADASPARIVSNLLTAVSRKETDFIDPQPL